jgi:hypothetical protein
MEKLKVGQKVYLLLSGNKARYLKDAPIEKRIEEHVVKKVGRKYFETWEEGRNFSTVKFYIDSRRQVTDYTEDYALYETKEEIYEMVERNRLQAQVRKTFRDWTDTGLTLDQLKRIDAIIQEGK